MSTTPQTTPDPSTDAGAAKSPPINGHGDAAADKATAKEGTPEAGASATASDSTAGGSSFEGSFGGGTSGGGTGGPGTGTETAAGAGGDAAIWVRLLYMVAYGFLGWVTFWALVILSVIQFIVTVLNGTPNKDLKTFNANLATYLWQVMSFVTMGRDDKPFPLSDFPKADQSEI